MDTVTSSVTGGDTRIGVTGGGGYVMAAPEGFSDKVAFVWKVADKLRGHFTRHEYGSVVLPLLVLRRLDNAAGQYARVPPAPLCRSSSPE